MRRQHASRYPFDEFEVAWQERWEAAGIFRADRDERRPKWFIMDLPPFANGKLHLGHVRNYVLADVSARFRRMAGYNVLYTGGFDSFGLPNEQAARESGCHPQELAERCIAVMRKQFVRLGLGHDTRRLIGAHEPAYYRWCQWVFLELVREGLAFRRKAKVNWCEPCQTALADALVDDGRCWRCGSAVVSHVTEQWFVREDGFADAMLEGFAALDGWPETIKQIQIDWIGRREGVEARFAVVGEDALAVTAFLEEPALLPAVSFVGVGLGHPALDALRRAGRLSPEVREALDDTDRHTLATRAARRQSFATPEAIRLGISVRHPLTGAELPLVALESLEQRDSAVAGCPGHVRGDRRVADGLGLPRPVALRPPEGGAGADPADFDARWTAVGAFAGLSLAQARRAVLDALGAAGLGGKAVRYRLRDWSIARQRYWGTPVPIIHCSKCGAVPVPEAELPVLLPQEVDLQAPGNPLERHERFLSAPCPRCGGPGRRDSDTLEAYCSPWWYHFNCHTLGNDTIFDPADTRYWMPVDLMVGGIDQARTTFFHTRMSARALTRMGHSLHDEPVRELVAIGLVKQGGRKMSKSAGNMVNPEELLSAFGADALRVGTMGAAAPGSDLNWSDQSVRQAHGFLADLWSFVLERCDVIRLDARAPAATLSLDTATALRRRLEVWLRTGAERITTHYVRHDLHLAVKNAFLFFERLVQFDREATARSAARAPADAEALAEGVSVLLRLLAPLAPHMAEELWHRCGGKGFVATAPWPAPVDPRDERANGGRPAARQTAKAQDGRAGASAPPVDTGATAERTRVTGPLFDAVERVLLPRGEYRRFREGTLPRADYARFLDRSAGALMAAGVPAADVHFAKRFPASIDGFVGGALADLVRRGVLPTDRYDRALLTRTRATAARYEHGGNSTYIYPEEAQLLFALANIAKPRRAVFLGSYYGYWAHWALPSIASGSGRAVLVDPDEAVQRVAAANLARSEYADAAELITTTGERFLDGTRELFDLVVLDAEGPRDHPDPEQRGKRIYRLHLEHVLPRLAPGALVVCHNILLTDHSGAAFFDGVLARNRDELGPFLALAERELEGFTEYASTEGVGVGRRRRDAAGATGSGPRQMEELPR